MDFQLSNQALPSFSSMPVKATTNAYTDLNSLNAIKNEKNEDEALKKVAKQFESLFVHELLKNMRKANSAFEDNNFLDNKESKFFRDMYDQQLSVTLSERGMGLADTLYKQMKSSYGAAIQSQPVDGKPQAVGVVPPRATKLSPEVPLVSARASSKDDTVNASANTANLSSFETVEDFINSVLPMAKKAASSLGLDPLIMLAQSALETGWGKHIIQDDQGASSNNLFNIKADSQWAGDKVAVSTLEYRDGHPMKEQAFFRKYESIEDSVNDFVSFITSNPRYQQAIDVAEDGKEFIQQLHRSGYATDPDYAKKIVSVFQRISNTISTVTPTSGVEHNVK